MRKHASLDELALLDAGALKPRKAAKVRSHLAQCGECSLRHAALCAVPSMLASVPYEPLPDSVASRLGAAIATESARRMAAQPGTEAARGMLPERSRRSGLLAGAGLGWRMPSLSGPAVRALATAGAVAVVVGGGIGVATQLGGTTPSSSSAGAVHNAAPAGEPTLHKGASVRYGHGSSARRVEEVTATTNFVPARLTRQVSEAIRAEQHSVFGASKQANASFRGLPATSASSRAGGGTTSSAVSATGDRSSQPVPSAASAAPVPTAGELAGCLDDVLPPGQKVQLLEHAKFEGKPATIIVTAAAPGHREQIWVVGDYCSATNRNVLFHEALASNS